MRQICETTRPGRKVANAFQGELSPVFVEERMRGRSLEEKVRIMRDWKNIFQPQRDIEQIVVPYASDLFAIVTDGTPLIYKGVSYNPMIATYGENVNILDFFSWLASSDLRGIVLDASLYAIVNASQQSLVSCYSKDAAQEAVNFLKSGMAKFPDIVSAGRTRGRYLRGAALSLFPVGSQPLVVDAEMLWESKRYLDCMQAAIAFCAGQPKNGSPLEIRAYANYTRYNTPYQRWYSVLVLAEALYLYDVYGVGVKLGPTTESNFDSLIRDFMQSLGIRYGFIWYDRGIEKQFAYPELLFFEDSAQTIADKLKNQRLSTWISEITAPFIGRELSVDKLAELVQKIRFCAERNPSRLPAEGGWFLTFPPGACD